MASTCPRARARSSTSRHSRCASQRGCLPCPAPRTLPACCRQLHPPRPRPPPPTPPQNDRLTGKCVYFARVNPKGVSEKGLEADLVAGDIAGPGALDAFRALVSDVYLPILQVRRRAGVACMRLHGACMVLGAATDGVGMRGRC